MQKEKWTKKWVGQNTNGKLNKLQPCTTQLAMFSWADHGGEHPHHPQPSIPKR